MSVRNQLKLLVGGLGTKKGDPASPPSSGFREFLDRSRLVAGLIFIVTVAAIVLVSSAGMRVLDLPVLPSQIAPVRIVAGVPYSYISEEKTRVAREQALNRLPRSTGSTLRPSTGSRTPPARSFPGWPRSRLRTRIRRRSFSTGENRWVPLPRSSTCAGPTRPTRTTWPPSSPRGTRPRAQPSSRTGSRPFDRSTARASTTTTPPRAPTRS